MANLVRGIQQKINLGLELKNKITTQESVEGIGIDMNYPGKKKKICRTKGRPLEMLYLRLKEGDPKKKKKKTGDTSTENQNQEILPSL